MFIGNKKAVKLLERIIKGKKIAQAHIFSGPESVGKFALAKIFSRAIINDHSFSSMLGSVEENSEKETLPLDLVILEPEVEEKKGIKKEKKIEIERIREIQKELALYPYQGKYKVLIINNAHKMTENSQNALLKILEEPNPTTIIILVTHEEGRILPTIRSRCQKVTFNLVSPDEIKEKIPSISKGIGSEEIMKFSLGRPGLARKIAESKDDLNFRREALEKLKSLSKAGVNQRLKIAEKLAKNISETTAVLELWIWALHVPALENVKLFKIIGKMEESLDDIKNTNANARLILENLLLNL